MKTCIAYFSKAGNTAIVAEYLADKIGAKMIRLDDKTNYKGFMGFVKGGMNASKAKMAELDPSVYEDIAQYDRIILATPVWAGKTTPAINSILESVDFQGKEVVVVTTQAMPTEKDTEEKKRFYKERIEETNGTFINCFSLQGSAPGKPPKNREDLIRQVDEIVKIV